ncbi:two-component sensor histidine kinase [Lentibacillus kapialis]|uniref:histidine kinase n=1 Tax=Lentibacillus kapialis TaxID=340214 RepID=A0A917Q172_9BACI|nr:ATP-binding protein [Lentibacillus kapialis]GGK05057.1 two-component sensor histidine kinase [Lentibacillus kapialis]
MQLTFRSKIFVFFLIVSLSGVFLTSFSIFFGVENQFSNYLRESREQNIDLIREEATNQYMKNDELVNQQLSDLMHEQAMTENLFYKIYDNKENLLIDTTTMLKMMDGMGMHERASADAEYASNMYPLQVDGREVGSIQVVYPVELVGAEVSFLDSIKRNIVIAVLVIVLLSIVFSLLFSRQLTSGFHQLTQAIQQLRQHNWRARVPLEKLTHEMKPLGESFNQLAATLSKEEKLRKQFTADFAHELRTPLSTLRSQLEAYQDGIWEPTPKRLQQSHAELMRLVRLINELEKLIAVENPQLQLKMTAIEAGEIAGALERQFTSLFQEKGIGLYIDKPEKEYWFNGDRDKVIQILTNIINNALQYTPAGKNVTLTIAETDKQVHFQVKDEGNGIGKEDLPYLFERFYRGDKSRDTKTGGIGIGLSIVKALVDAHQGDIHVESEEGAGTMVTVSFRR